MKRRKLWLGMATAVIAGAAGVWGAAYWGVNTSGNTLLRANVEALMQDEAKPGNTVADCDIYTYVRNAKEDWSKPSPVTVEVSPTGQAVIPIGGIKIPVSVQFKVGATYSVVHGICPDKDGNCCLKAHLQNIQRQI